MGELNKRQACRENSLVITKLEEALHWLKHRSERVNKPQDGEQTPKPIKFA